MAKTITLRLSDTAYEAVKRYADTEKKSMNSWIESLLEWRHVDSDHQGLPMASQSFKTH